MSEHSPESRISRRAMLERMGTAAASAVVLPPILQAAILPEATAIAASGQGAPVNGVAGVDRVVVLPGKTYLRGWAGYGDPPRPGPRRPTAADSTPPAPPSGPPPTVRWTRRAGPGTVTFTDPT